MKYKFVYDEGFLSDNFVELSKIEREIVLATVLGGHNAVFYGYKPSRLTKAIKLLSDKREPFVNVPLGTTLTGLIGNGDGFVKGYCPNANGGILCVNKLNQQSATFRYMLDVVMHNQNVALAHAGTYKEFPAKFQLIATMGNTISWSTYNDVLDSCDVVYECKQSTEPIPMSVESLRYDLERAIIRRNVRGPDKVCDLTSIQEAGLSSQCRDDERELELSGISEELRLRYVKVARSLAYIRGHGLVWARDLESARNYYSPCE